MIGKDQQQNWYFHRGYMQQYGCTAGQTRETPKSGWEICVKWKVHLSLALTHFSAENIKVSHLVYLVC